MPAITKPVVHRLCAALMVALAAPVAVHAQEAGTQADTPAMKTLDQVTVTGSRIRRADAEESLPITSFSKEQIDAAGISSAEQLLMQLNIAGNGSDNLPATAASSARNSAATTASRAPTCAARARTPPWSCSTAAAWRPTA